MVSEAHLELDALGEFAGFARSKKVYVRGFRLMSITEGAKLQVSRVCSCGQPVNAVCKWRLGDIAIGLQARM